MHPAGTEAHLEVTHMSKPTHILLVAHQTAATQGLLDLVRQRAEHGQATFHLVVPKRPHGIDRFVNPEDASSDESEQVLAAALPALSAAAGSEVTGSVGDAQPLMAIEDAVNFGSFDEIIISTLPLGASKWLKLDLVSKAKNLGLPVTHIAAKSTSEAMAGV